MYRPILLMLFLTSVPALSFANYDPPGQSEEHYALAVATLNKAEAELEELFSLYGSPPPIEIVQEQMISVGARMRPAVEQLEKAAKLGHPVAQYRLGLFYQTYSAGEREDEACLLLKASLDSAFAPAAMRIANGCRGLASRPEFFNALVKAEAAMSLYENYYPQPAAYLECGVKQPSGITPQWGSQNDYLAELYKLMGNQSGLRTAKDKRISYYQKAVAINGCPYAEKRLTILQK